MTMTEQSTAPAVDALLTALKARDLPGIGACLTDDVRFRALVPPGPFELNGPADVIARLERWFGGEDDFELLESSAHRTGACYQLTWLVRMRNDAGRRQIVEQYAFARLEGERIVSLDLLCSGFHDEV
jgi:hypothetical protein